MAQIQRSPVKSSFTNLTASLGYYINISLAAQLMVDFIDGDWESHVNTVPSARGFLIEGNESLHP